MSKRHNTFWLETPSFSAGAETLTDAFKLLRDSAAIGHHRVTLINRVRDNRGNIMRREVSLCPAEVVHRIAKLSK